MSQLVAKHWPWLEGRSAALVEQLANCSVAGRDFTTSRLSGPQFLRGKKKQHRWQLTSQKHTGRGGQREAFTIGKAQLSFTFLLLSHLPNGEDARPETVGLMAKKGILQKLLYSSGATITLFHILRDLPALRSLKPHSTHGRPLSRAPASRRWGVRSKTGSWIRGSSVHTAKVESKPAAGRELRGHVPTYRKKWT